MTVAVPSLSKSLRRRADAGGARLVVVLGVAFGLLMFVGAHVGREFTSIFFQKVGTASSQTGDAPRTNGSSAPRDPYQDFLQSKVGHLMFSSHQNDNCKLMLFNNHTGSTVEAGEVMCGNGWVKTDASVDQQRVRQLLQAFRK